MMLTFVLIGSCDYFGFHFPTLMSDHDRIFLTISIQSQPDMWWEQQNISIWG